jgi:hypothetical protein
VVKSKGEATLISNKPPAESVAAVGRTLLYGSFVKVHTCPVDRTVWNSVDIRVFESCYCVLLHFSLLAAVHLNHCLVCSQLP